jgi:hypothetical protein
VVLQVAIDNHDEVDGLRQPTLRRVPHESVEIFQRKVRDVMHGYSTADANGKASCAHALLSLPKIYLAVIKERGVGATIRRLERALPRVPPGIVLVQRGDATGTAEDPKIRRARKKAREGYSGRAARILFSEEHTSTLTEEEKIAALRELHPRVGTGAVGTGTDPIPTGHASVLDVDVERFRRILRKGCRGSSSGRTGWTEELLCQLLEDDATATAMMPLILDIANDRVNASVRNRLTACNLSALAKPKNGIRPIAVGETLLKLASAYVLATLNDVVSELFRPLQLGIGTPGGCERIIHTLRSELTDKSVLCTIDFRNAFNTPFRSAMRRALLQHPRLSPLYDLFNLAYSTPSALHYCGTVIDSCRGARQGDPLGGFLFCICLQDALVEAANTFPTVSILAYMDDITLHSATGDSAEVTRCFKFLEGRANAVGMEVRGDKCEWFAHSPPPAGLPFKHVDAGTKCIRILGGYLGPDCAVRQQLKMVVTDALPKHFQKTVEMGGQEGLCILRKCLLPQLSFLIRTHSPELTLECCRFFDEQLLTCLEAYAQAPIRGKTNAIRMLPTRLGGLGFADVNAIARHAYAASVEGSQVDIKLSVAAFRDATDAVKSQGARTEGLYVDLLRDITTDDADTYNLLIDASTPGCSAWLQRCSDWDRPLTTAEVGAMLRLRLGAVHGSISDLQCPGCHKSFPGIRFSAHLSGCARIHAANVSAAHASLKRGIKRLARTCGVAYDDAEPTGYDSVTCPRCKASMLAEGEAGNDFLVNHVSTCTATPKVTIDELLHAHRSRPDIRFFPAELAGKGLVIDVSTTANVLQHAAGATPPTALLQVTERERTKDRLYKKKVEAAGNDLFLAVVGTAFGAFSTVAQPMFSLLANEKGRMTEGEVRAATASMTARARSQALINGERQAGVAHTVIDAAPSAPRSVKREAAPSPSRSLHESFLQAAGVSTPPTPAIPIPLAPTPLTAATRREIAPGMMMPPSLSTPQMGDAPNVDDDDDAEEGEHTKEYQSDLWSSLCRASHEVSVAIAKLTALAILGYVVLELDARSPDATRGTAAAAVAGYALHTQRAALLRAASNPRVAFAAALIVVTAAMYVSPSLRTLSIVCAIGAGYVACELHAAGNLASYVASLFTKLTLVALMLVTVVITFTLSKLPQLTITELETAIVMADPSWTSYFKMVAKKAAPSLLTLALRIGGVVAGGPAGAALVLASNSVAAANGGGQV